MDKIRDIDTASNTMTCEAGVVLQLAQQRAAEVDRLFPLSLGAEGSCTIGGNLSTNAGGTAALAYGVAREMALGLEVVLADGRVLQRAVEAEKGQYRLRSEATFHRRRRHARHHHRGDPEAFFPKPRAVGTAFPIEPFAGKNYHFFFGFLNFSILWHRHPRNPLEGEHSI